MDKFARIIFFRLPSQMVDMYETRQRVKNQPASKTHYDQEDIPPML